MSTIVCRVTCAVAGGNAVAAGALGWSARIPATTAAAPAATTATPTATARRLTGSRPATAVYDRTRSRQVALACSNCGSSRTACGSSAWPVPSGSGKSATPCSRMHRDS